MNEEQRLRQLAAIARLESAPPVDVAASVMARLCRRAAEAVPSVRPLAWVAGLSAALAVPLTVAAMYVLQHWTDPLLGVLLEPPLGLS